MDNELVLLSVPQAMERYGLSRKLVVRLAGEAGGLYKLGDRLLKVDVEKLDAYIRTLNVKGEDEQ